MLIIELTQTADPRETRAWLVARGLWLREFSHDGKRCFLTLEHSIQVSAAQLRSGPGIAAVLETASFHPLVDRQPTTVRVANHVLGPGEPPIWIAGPCGVESEQQIHTVAAQLSALGVSFLRGGAFKPRTSPYAFQGHGFEALVWLRDAARAHGMGCITEAVDGADVQHMVNYVDWIQIGARNMYNYALLKKVGQLRTPVLLKRGFSATLEEWISAGEYLLFHGAESVVFCERGIRHNDPSTRNLLDVGAVALLSQIHGFPVVADPSHAVGRRDLVYPLGAAALAAGACGLMVEVHPDPGQALSDGPQALLPSELAACLPGWTQIARTR